MNCRKYIYVSPQQSVTFIDDWSSRRHTVFRYEYVVDGKMFKSATFPWRQGMDAFRKIELSAWRHDKTVRKLSTVEWRKLSLRMHARTECTSLQNTL